MKIAKNLLYLIPVLSVMIALNAASVKKHYEEILFYPDSDRIKEQYDAELDRIAFLLKESADAKVILHGYTNATGEPDLEKDLSIKRSLKAADYLISRGIDTNRIQVIGYGSAFLKVKKIDELNRRVVVEFDIPVTGLKMPADAEKDKKTENIKQIVEASKNELKKIYIEITDKNGNVLQARVEITKFENEIRVFRTEKDINLKEEIFVPYGNLTVLASAEGYFPKKVQISEKENKIVITLDKIAKNEKFEVQAIYFDRSSASIKKESYDILNKIYNILKNNDELNLIIEGHTDGAGAGMLELSELRSLNVKKYLVKKGIDEKRINSKGLGYGMPKYPLKENYKNRRIEFYFY